MKLETKKTMEHGIVAVVTGLIMAFIGFIVNHFRGIFDKNIDAQTEATVVVEEPAATTETVNTNDAEVVEAEVVTDETVEQQ